MRIFPGAQVGTVVIVERGCAMQAYEYQDMVRGKWRTIIKIMVCIVIVCIMKYASATSILCCMG
jgi:hypothetical protein